MTVWLAECLYACMCKSMVGLGINETGFIVIKESTCVEMVVWPQLLCHLIEGTKTRYIRKSFVPAVSNH